MVFIKVLSDRAICRPLNDEDDVEDGGAAEKKKKTAPRRIEESQGNLQPAAARGSRKN